MNKNAKKRLITECIRGWYILDNVLFGGKPEYYLKEHKKVQNDYNQLKKKYLTTIFEFYTKIGYKSTYITLPKNSEQIECSARFISESLKKDLNKEFNKNYQKYCKIITENVDIRNEKILEKRTHYLGRMMMLEKFFVQTPYKSRCVRQLNDQEIAIYKNCLSTLCESLINISSKYYSKF